MKRPSPALPATPAGPASTLCSMFVRPTAKEQIRLPKLEPKKKEKVENVEFRIPPRLLGDKGRGGDRWELRVKVHSDGEADGDGAQRKPEVFKQVGRRPHAKHVGGGVAPPLQPGGRAAAYPGLQCAGASNATPASSYAVAARAPLAACFDRTW